MERKIITTGDGSHTVLIPEMDVTYHSIHGAVRESQHVFIEKGLLHQIKQLTPDQINIFEMGFGTGLNALLTLIQLERSGQKIYYKTCESFPLNNDEIKSLNYCRLLERNDLQKVFEQLHNSDWEKEITITPTFTFRKTKVSLLNLRPCETVMSRSALTAAHAHAFNLIYFDAFDPNVQPELWTEEIFKTMFSILEPGGVIVTYSSKGKVRRAMQAAGFIVEKLPGPPGKREMIRATKFE